MTQPEPAEPELSTDESFEGQTVGGKYKVGRLVGSGGMGTVWLGEHTGLGTRVAIKFIRLKFAERADARRRFEIEARAAASVDSKHVVKVYDYGVTDDGLPYIVMEYLEGESLSEVLIRRGPLGAEEAAKVIRQASRALAKAHAANVVHRDLKPDNIFLATNVDADEREGLPYLVKIVDFGIAKVLDVAIGHGMALKGPTQAGAVIGTPNFMSPEQLTVGGMPSPLSDIWSLGACAYAAFTARIPFEGEVLGDIVLKVCVEPLPSVLTWNPAAPPAVDTWFRRACHREPHLRFQNVEEMSDALGLVCGLGVSNASSTASALSSERMRYAFKRTADSVIDELPDELPRPAMNAKTAMLAGIIVGVCMMVAVAGILAWRETQGLEGPPSGTGSPASSTSASRPSAR